MSRQTLHLLVTGARGQIATALQQLAQQRPESLKVTTVGRPALDLEKPDGIAGALADHDPDVVVNAAAWTAVEDAERTPERALLANGRGAGAVAAVAAEHGLPVIQLSTDYVFAGDLDRPYREDDATGPINVYGASKLAGEIAVAAANPDHCILRTSWVYGPHGQNFLLTMLRLATQRSEVGVVADQFGRPTAATDIADAIVHVAARLAQSADPALRGVFHMTASGPDASWADFAEAIFAASRQRGGPSTAVRRLTTAEYPTLARRPLNARLDNARFETTFGYALPAWPDALARCMDTWAAARKDTA